MTNTYWLPKEIEVETKITIVKKDTIYYAVIEQEGYSIKEVFCFIDKFGGTDADECRSDDEWNAVTETFQNYIIANGVKYARKCDKCGNGMNEGYVVEGGQEYYCTPKCLHEVYTPMEWQNRFSDECTENYWTEWDNIGSEYFLFNNQLINI